MEYIFLGWIIWTAMNGMIASERGRSVGGVVLVSLVMSPITAYLYLIATPCKTK